MWQWLWPWNRQACPPEPRSRSRGGFGYYNNRTAGTASFTARIGNMSSFSAGVGIGLNSGEVGARAGFQHAW